MTESDGLRGLRHARSAFDRQWAEARALWRDQVAGSFELKCYQPIARKVASMQTAAEELLATYDEALDDLGHS